MNKIIMLMWLSIFIQCQSQKIDKYMIPIVDNKYEKFDIENFQKKSVRGYLKVRENSNTYIQDFQSPGYREMIYNDNLFYKVTKFFYENGNIEKKGCLFNEGSVAGIWYYFDKSGKIIKEENTDEGYGFKPEDIIVYCEKNKINLSKGYHDSGYQTRVLKQDFEGKKVWRISHQTGGDSIEEIILDGKTGKELQKKTVPFYNS
ncbi:hypothetical protein [Chryseobacterium indologenes]|uniref:hypothetical protein n=1 Tax=Chryseobacterium indologenes TaxID=253 RepID=UPI00301631EB